MNGEAWVPDWNEERSHNYPLSLPLSTAYRLTRIEGRGKMTLSSPSAQEAVVRETLEFQYEVLIKETWLS